MRMVPVVTLLLLLLASDPPVAPSAPEHSTPAARAATATAVGAILQGNGAKARQIMAGIPASELSAQAAGLMACARSRLDDPPPATPVISPLTHQPDAFATQVLRLYRSYWQAGVNDPAGRKAAEQKLLEGLSGLLQHPSLASLDDAEPLVIARLTGAGFHALAGTTGVLHELMLWTQQKEQMETVTLPEGTTTTKVFYLDGFVSRGWSTYFLCDQIGTGGWAKPEGLYVVVPGYSSLSDENFRVSFLAHESQHYSDHRRFPGLAGWELEYRAKLVELAYANQTRQQLLLSFTGNQGDDPADAHSYADKRLLAALRARLGLASGEALDSVAVETLQHAALEELQADTARREHSAQQ
jgi:hypothetical protein